MLEQLGKQAKEASNGGKMVDHRWSFDDSAWISEVC